MTEETRDILKSSVKTEGYGSVHGYLKIEINVETYRYLTNDEQNEIRGHLEKIRDILVPETIRQNPEAMAGIAEERTKLLGLFDHSIFVEEIPNQYSNDPWFQMHPWFKITTPIGRFTVGWRKRVINIDWSETLVKATGEDLFPEETVTRGDTYIHAYGYEDAQRYINTIFEKYNSGVYMSSGYIDKFNYLVRDALRNEGRGLTAEEQLALSNDLYQQCQGKISYENLSRFILPAVIRNVPHIIAQRGK